MKRMFKRVLAFTTACFLALQPCLMTVSAEEGGKAAPETEIEAVLAESLESVTEGTDETLTEETTEAVSEEETEGTGEIAETPEADPEIQPDQAVTGSVSDMPLNKGEEEVAQPQAGGKFIIDYYMGLGSNEEPFYMALGSLGTPLEIREYPPADQIPHGKVFRGYSTNLGASSPQYQVGDKVQPKTGENLVSLYAVWGSSPVLNAGKEYPFTCDCQVTYEDQIVSYRFTPDITTSYTFQSFGDMNTVINIFRANTGELCGYDNNQESGEKNFDLTVNLEAGVSYYVEMQIKVNKEFYDPSSMPPLTGTFSLELTRNLTELPSDIYEGYDYTENVKLADGEKRYYVFTPEQYGDYVFESTGSADTYASLTSLDGSVKLDCDDQGTDHNFKITARLFAGQTCILTVSGFKSSACQFKLKVSSNVVLDLPIYRKGSVTVKNRTGRSGTRYKMVPQVTGLYIFETTGNYDTFAILLNGEKEVLDYAESGGSGKNYRYVVELEKGKTYYLASSQFYVYDASYTLNFEPASNPFVDVKSTDYYYNAVLAAYAKNITKGSDATHFNPDAVCTRAQVVTFLWRAKGQPEPKDKTNPFVDVSSSSAFYKAILWAKEAGITDGTDKTHFSPDATVTRGQVVTFIWRAMGKPEPADKENPFVDVQSNSPFYTAILWAKEEGITTGKDATHFLPAGNCTRAQVVTFLYRAKMI